MIEDDDDEENDQSIETPSSSSSSSSSEESAGEGSLQLEHDDDIEEVSDGRSVGWDADRVIRKTIRHQQIQRQESAIHPSGLCVVESGYVEQLVYYVHSKQGARIDIYKVKLRKYPDSDAQNDQPVHKVTCNCTDFLQRKPLYCKHIYHVMHYYCGAVFNTDTLDATYLDDTDEHLFAQGRAKIQTRKNAKACMYSLQRGRLLAKATQQDLRRREKM